MWFTKSQEEVLKELNVDSKTGLTTEEVNKRLEKYGQNKLKGKPKKKFISAIFRAASGCTYLCIDWSGGN